jgi:hypothetical protein
MKISTTIVRGTCAVCLMASREKNNSGTIGHRPNETLIQDHADCPVGCRKVNYNAGWSNRIMWRKKGNLVSYSYLPDKTIRCGVDLPWNRKAVPGEWHEIKLYMKMNNPGESSQV